MPSIRMKSSTDCLREKKSLRVCQKSNLIFKRSWSHVKNSQLATELGCSMHNGQDVFAVSSSNETTMHDIGIVEPSNHEELLNGEDAQSDKHPTSLVVSTPVERTGSTAASCSPNFETIFSPTMDKFEVRNEPNLHDDRGGNIDWNQPYFAAAEESDGNSGSSSEHQTCNISDFYISDMVLASFPFDGSAVCDHTAKTNLFPEYDTVDSSIIFDAGDQCLALPFLDDSVDFNGMQCGQLSKGGNMDSDDSSFFQAIHQMTTPDQGYDVEPYSDSDQTGCFDPHSFIGNLPELSDALSSSWPIVLPKESQKRKPITLVLDLDETLVHSTLEHCEDANFTFTVFFNLKEHTVYVKQRPHLQTFLEKVAEMFEIVVFTASQSIYAAQLLDVLDPGGKLISGRAYRESCIFSDGTYTKDLTVLGVDLAKVAIIDNSPQVFRLQVNNGIPIKSWFDDPSDNELISLIPFLETLVDVDDVRPIIAKRFGNKE
ncbi:hypothetical protein Ancab_034162 [Ancistrocladus abbreviatus]